MEFLHPLYLLGTKNFVLPGWSFAVSRTQISVSDDELQTGFWEESPLLCILVSSKKSEDNRRRGRDWSVLFTGWFQLRGGESHRFYCSAWDFCKVCNYFLEDDVSGDVPR